MTDRLHPIVIAAVLVLLPIARPLAGQQVAPVRIDRITDPINLDGRLDESVWQEIAPFPLVMFTPIAGNVPTDQSEIRLAYDDVYLYASGRFLVSDPAQIQATSLTRDVFGADDLFRIVLDTFDDNENAVAFSTTPEGVRIDFSISDDGEVQNYGWNTFWDVAAERTPEGWSAEMRIPLSSLRFQESPSGVRMGLTVARYSAGKNELATWPALSPEWANAEFRPSISGQILLDGVTGRRPFYVTPYALGGSSRSAVLAADQPAFDHEDDGTAEAGVDVKYGLTPNLTLDVTVNTDFAQVEVDDEQVNLTRFSLFFPEKRQFFLERGGVFSIGTGGPTDGSLFFHSRRIGLAPDGNPLRLYGGARLVGRVGDWDVGLLDMQSETADLTSTENLGAFRLSRRVLNDESDVGVMVTTRLGEDGRNDAAYIGDARLRFRRNDYLVVQAAQNQNEATDGSGVDAAMFRVAWERPSTLFSQGWGYHFGAKFSGRDYAPGLGFTPRRDFQHYIANVRYGWFPKTSIFRSIQPSVNVSTYLRNLDQSLDSSMAALFVNYSLKSGATGWIGVMRREEDLQSPLPFADDVVVPEGRHDFTQVQFVYQPSIGSLFGVDVSAVGGEFFDGTQFDLGLGPRWSVSEHLELGAEYNISRIRFDDRDQALDADIVRLRAKSAINARISTNVFVQYNRAADAVSSNVRFRYHFAEGKDLFIVYNTRLNTDRDRLDPRLPLEQERTLLVKWTYTWGS